MLWTGVAVARSSWILARPVIDRVPPPRGHRVRTSVVFSYGILFLVIVNIHLCVRDTLPMTAEELATEIALLNGIRHPDGDENARRLTMTAPVLVAA